jgi:hypothetical protein
MTTGQLQSLELNSMIEEISNSVPESFSPESKIWIYQSNRPFSESEKEEAAGLLQAFANNWLSHGKKVKGLALILFNQFIILAADESTSSVSGCSTDSSVRLIKEIEQKLNIQLFDRQKLAFLINGEIKIIPVNEFAKALDQGILTPETIYFNNPVDNLNKFKNNWMIRIDQSWLSSRLNKISV